MFAAKRLFRSALSVCALLCASGVHAEYSTRLNDNITLHSQLTRDDQCPDGDGAAIDANVYIPQGSPGETYPALIFVPGWGMDKYEYILQAENFSKKGYIVLSYSPRGMGESEGVIEVVSPLDIADFCAAVDWLIDNTPVDPERIGAYGMSYGGGVSLVGLGHDPRIRVVGSASTWGDLQNSLYEADTPNLVWMNNLILTGNLRARLSSVIFAMKDRLLHREELDTVIEWARFRSPLTYMDEFNSRETLDFVTGETVPGVPLYISKNNGDYLFKTNRLLELYERSVGPKKMDTNLGIHSMQEQAGMQLKPNTTWDNLHLWFDYWLKGENNGVLQAPPVSMRVKNWRYRDYFAQWPSENVNTETLFLNRDAIGGYLAPQVMAGSESVFFSAGEESGARIGVPVLSAFLEGAGVLHRIDRFKVDPETSAEFVTASLDETLKIRGTINVSAWIRSEKPAAHVVAYLFEMDESGSAALISHGPVTVHDLIPGEPVEVNFEMATVAYDVNPGKQLLLFIDGFEWLYDSPYDNAYSVEVLLGEDYPSRVEIPVRIREESVAEEPIGEEPEDEAPADRGVNGTGNTTDGKTMSGGSVSLLLFCLLIPGWLFRRRCSVR